MRPAALNRIVPALLVVLLVPQIALGQGDTLFRYKGFDYGDNELSPQLRQALFDLDMDHYRQHEQLLNDALVDVYLKQVADDKGITLEAARAELLPVTPPTEQQLRVFYDQNKQRIPYPFEQVKERIAQVLAQQSVGAKKAELVASLKQDGEFQILMPRPEAPFVEIATDGYPSKGPQDAPVTVVEFADFQCPHCKTASAVIDKLRTRFGDQMRVVYMDLPINPSGISRVVAWGAVCADRQGKFWQYHDLALNRQAMLNETAPFTLAESLGLDQAEFKLCFEGEEAPSKVARSEAEARRLGLTSTPTIYVNGRKVIMQDMEGDLGAAIQSALDEAS
jgi:protein-disulfide isomerase